MDRAVALAAEHGVGVGAHPGFPDAVGFGRRNMGLTPMEIETDVLYQIGALAAFCRKHGVSLKHVKPHGNLYNLAARDRETAMAVARAVRAFDPGLILMTQARSELQLAGLEHGLRLALEVFADRAYGSDGSLISRRQAGAVIHDPEIVVPSRGLRITKVRKAPAQQNRGIKRPRLYYPPRAYFAMSKISMILLSWGPTLVSENLSLSFLDSPLLG